MMSVTRNLIDAIIANDIKLLARTIVDNSHELSADIDGLTPLMVAVMLDKVDAARLILWHGADINQVAHYQPMKDWVVKLLQRQGSSTANKLLPEIELALLSDALKGHSALHHGAICGSTNCMKMLIDYGANIECRTGAGCTPIHLAVIENRVECMKLLLQAGAKLTTFSMPPKVNESPKLQVSILHAAVRSIRGHDCLEYLLKNHPEVDINFQPETQLDGVTPLHLAICHGKCEAVRILIKYGADPNIEDVHGNSALAIAKFGSNKQMLAILDGNDYLEESSKKRKHSSPRAGKKRVKVEVSMLTPDNLEQLGEPQYPLILPLPAKSHNNLLVVPGNGDQNLFFKKSNPSSISSEEIASQMSISPVKREMELLPSGSPSIQDFGGTSFPSQASSVISDFGPLSAASMTSSVLTDQSMENSPFFQQPNVFPEFPAFPFPNIPFEAYGPPNLQLDPQSPFAQQNLHVQFNPANLPAGIIGLPLYSASNASPSPEPDNLPEIPRAKKEAMVPPHNFLHPMSFPTQETGQAWKKDYDEVMTSLAQFKKSKVFCNHCNKQLLVKVTERENNRFVLNHKCSGIRRHQYVLGVKHRRCLFDHPGGCLVFYNDPIE